MLTNIFPRINQNLLSKTLFKKTKDVVVGSCLAGTVISRKMVIAAVTGVVKANGPGKTYAFLYF